MNEATKSRVWYREPWPWILMSGPAVAVIGSLVSAYLAIHGADPVVDEDYYQHGLEINRELAQQPQASPSRVQPDLQGPGARRGEERPARGQARIDPSPGR
jgi:hypothetical protein